MGGEEKGEGKKETAAASIKEDLPASGDGWGGGVGESYLLKGQDRPSQCLLLLL